MLKGLRKRLAVIFTAITGAVLAAVLGVSLYFSIVQITNEADLWFSNTVDRVTGTVLNNSFTKEKTVINPGDYLIYAARDGQVMDGLVTTDAATAGAPQGLFEAVRTKAQEQNLANWVSDSIHFFGFSQVTSAAAATAADLQVNMAENSYMEDGSPSEFGIQANDAMGVVSVSMMPVVGTDGIFTIDHQSVQYRATYYSWSMLDNTGHSTLYEIAIMENLVGQNGRILMAALWNALLLLAGLAGLFVANWFLAKLVLRPTTESLRRQTEFVAAASHELRSPLAVIRSSLSAAEDAGSPEEAERFQTAAGEEAERMSHLVDDLLLLAGGDAGSWQLNRAPVDLDTLLIGATEDYAALAKQRQVSLRLDLPDTALPQIEGDAVRLRQILAVLLDNALQYAPQGTGVEITAAHKKGRVRICVADHGQGIPDEEKEKVFQRFYRADKSRHSKSNFGLGLSIAQELARLHGGKLAVHDTQDGGATFILTL